MSDYQLDEAEKDGFHGLLVNQEFINWLKVCEIEVGMLANDATYQVEHIVDISNETNQRSVMSAEDREQRAHDDAVRSEFYDVEMQKLIKNPGFTILRFTVQANRLIALASKDTSPEVISDAKKAQDILDSIERFEE